jgi:Mn2+/Fe2+ NRAMP family transporter
MVGLVSGLVFGVVFAAVGYGATRGRRDFTSASQIVAGRYDVLCQPRHARRLVTCSASWPCAVLPADCWSR